jgi:hypothetical protein
MKPRHAPRSLLLLFLGAVTAFGCIVPGVFHDSWRQEVSSYGSSGSFCRLIGGAWEVRYARNRLTGDVLRGPAD